MRESRWPPPFTRALKRNLQGSFLLGYGCWVLGVDEVWEGQKLQYYIGLIGRIRLIWQIRLIRSLRLMGRLMVNRSFRTNVTNIL